MAHSGTDRLEIPRISGPERLVLLAGYPTVLLLGGLLLFYSQVAFGWWTVAGKLALALSAVCALALAAGGAVLVLLVTAVYRNTDAELVEAGISRRLRTAIFGVLLALLLAMAFSALKPAHLFPEGDFLEYHLTIPQQHWLRGNWKPVDWNSMEFLTLTVDYALSPFWVSLPMFNRMPAVLFEGFLLVCICLSFRALGFARPALRGILTLLCFVSFRSVCIQLGITMIDLANLYLVVGAVLTLATIPGARYRRALSFILGVQLATYAAHKSFGLFYLGVMVVTYELLLRLTYKRSLLQTLRRVHWGLTLIPFFIIALPTFYRSWHYTGDPFFPLFFSHWPSHCDDHTMLVRTCADNLPATEWMVFVNQRMGWGRSILGLLKGFILVALPDDPFARHGFFFGRNAGDYPAGTFWYLVWLVLGLGFFTRKPDRKLIVFLACFVAVLYSIWFLVSQQGRWLYLPMLLLAFYWGHFLASIDWRQRPRSSLGQALLVISILGAGVSAGKVLGSQVKTLGCLGDSCLNFQPQLYADFHLPCATPPDELQLPRRLHLGYLRCPAHTGRTEIDMPWLKARSNW